MIEKILGYISTFLALMIVLPIHEFAHGFAAVKSGDPTPKLYNRYTLNPFAHFDISGLVCFVLVGFGWAKPVPINPNNFRHYKRGCFFTSVAGVVANYLLAFLVYPLFLLAFFYLPEFGYFTTVFVSMLQKTIVLSLCFMVFNLLPFYPLDGFRVVDVFVRRRGKIYWFLRTKGIYILYGLVLLSFVADLTNLYYLDVLGYIINHVVGVLEIPIIKFWGLIF